MMKIYKKEKKRVIRGKCQIIVKHEMIEKSIVK